jgi:DNA replication and repair protein RecF
VRVLAISLREFRSYERARIELGSGLTVLHGPNAAGKTNAIEALYLACTGRSHRTSNDRELVRFGAPAARAELRVAAEDGEHALAVGISRQEGKRMTLDGAAVPSLLQVPWRPLVSVFAPDRLALVKGTPALRRAHLDQFVGALWPLRAHTRRAYAQALAQRNALLARIRAGRVGREALPPWDAQLAELGVALMDDRRRATAELSGEFAPLARSLGLDGELALAYRPRSRAQAPAELADELASRLDGDLERGFTGHGPHRDEVSIARDGRELRVYGSQGEQRLALLALLLCERAVLARSRGAAPLVLLDDVMSELDPSRRRALVELLARTGGQAVIATADPAQVPSVSGLSAVGVAVRPGQALAEAAAA